MLMLEVGQIVKCGGKKYEIVGISSDPYMIFGDGSKHYVLSIKLCGGDRDDILYINDSQLDKN